MPKKWRVTAYDGQTIAKDWVIHGKGRPFIEALLGRLQASHLTDAEIIAASDGPRDSLAPSKSGFGPEYSTAGPRFYYTAEEEER
jgi:hypothetical protein